MAAQRTFVIVGASLAGAKAAESLRKEGFDGRVVLVGEEDERPYERPALSKDYLRGETPRERVYVHGEDFYAENGVELRTGTRVETIETGSSEVLLAGGERIRYDSLLLATGATPRRLSVPGAELDGVLYLRELGDSDRIRDRLAEGGRLVVVGGGWIGAEVAASAREKGVEVTMIYPSALPLERILGSEVATVYRDLHAERGVALAAQTRLEAFEGNGSVRRVRLGDRAIEADMVVVGIGVEPRTELAERARIRVEDGVAVDEHLATEVPGIFAAGDVANHRHPFYGRRIRIEHWRNARDQGSVVARNMLGRRSAYDRIPYFYSDQYDTAMEYWGHAIDWDRVVFRGDPGERDVVAFWLADGRVQAGMSLNSSDETDAIEAIIRARKEVDVDRLVDRDVPLAEVTGEPVARKPRPRGRPLTAAGNLVAEGVSYARRFVGDRLSRAEATPVDALADGEARVLAIDGDRVAVFKADDGTVHAVSPVCTHRLCLVEWNADERSWDCPCHGSRFGVGGDVLRGPAKTPLERKPVPGSGRR